MDRIRNERIRGTTKVGEISTKVQESRLKWYWHVLRREEEYVWKTVMVDEGGSGKRRRGARNGGGWISSGTACRIDNYGRKRKTELNGGV